MSTADVMIKRSQPLRILQTSGTAPGPGPSSVGPIFRVLVERLLQVLKSNGIEAGMSIGRYDELDEDGSLPVHVGFQISPSDTITDPSGLCIVVDLPVVTVASFIHHGPLDTLMQSNQQLAHWVQDSGHIMAGPSRELYLRFNDDDPALNITEIQAQLTS